jgi:hypothetical protein
MKFLVSLVFLVAAATYAQVKYRANVKGFKIHKCLFKLSAGGLVSPFRRASKP